MQVAGQGDKPLAITEMNIAYDPTPAGAAPSAAPGTVPSALWMADILGTALELGLFWFPIMVSPRLWSTAKRSTPPARGPKRCHPA